MKKRFNEDNSEKNLNGIKAKGSLLAQLEYLKEEGIIESIIEGFAVGYKDKDPNQFKCDFLILMCDGTKYAVDSASSITSDRLQTKEYRFENIKIIDPTVKQAFLILSDALLDNDKDKKRKYKDYMNYRNNIKTKFWKSYIDDIMLQHEFVDWLIGERFAYESEGRNSSQRGLKYEKWICKVLNYKPNLQIIKENKGIEGSWDYKSYSNIINGLEVPIEEISRIEATTDIANLPNYYYRDGTVKKGGRPKTDIALYISFESGEKKLYTISCKNTKQNVVSCYQWPVKFLSEIFCMTNELTELIEIFHECGGLTKMSEEDRDKLEKLILPYSDRINKFALCGELDDNILGYTEEQIARFLLTRHNGNTTFERIDSYIRKCKKVGYGDLGTIFAWTVTKKIKQLSGNEINYPLFKMKVFDEEKSINI